MVHNVGTSYVNEGSSDPMNPRMTRTVSAGVLATALCACGSTGPEVTAPTLDRVWYATEPGVEETTIELETDGSVRVIEADLTGRSCTSSAGVWTSDGSRLVLRLTPADGAVESDVRSFDYEVFGDSLVLDGGGTSTTFVPVSRAPSCVSYGFGAWQGTLSASIDDVPSTFTNLSVATDELGVGIVQILACPEGAAPCQEEDAVLVLRISAPPGPLTPGSYPLGDKQNGFYGLINPFPDDPDFPGFDTLRLAPSGVFLLTSVAEDWVVGTFEFRANERANNSPPAPDGRTFVLVTDGLVNLQYR
jgi:hypothetical protein